MVASNALALYLLKGLGVRHKVVGYLSALEANDPSEKVVLCRSDLSEVLLTKRSRHTSVQQGLYHLGL